MSSAEYEFIGYDSSLGGVNFLAYGMLEYIVSYRHKFLFSSKVPWDLPKDEEEAVKLLQIKEFLIAEDFVKVILKECVLPITIHQDDVATLDLAKEKVPDLALGLKDHA